MIKAKDLYFLIVAVGICGMLAFFVASLVFKTEKVKTPVEQVEAISSDFPLPDDTYFNKDSLNITQTITIGDENNQNPFQGR